jgi:hypothetical protein
VQHLLGHSSHAFAADVFGTVPDALARAETASTAGTVLAAMQDPRPVPTGRIVRTRDGAAALGGRHGSEAIPLPGRR